MEVLKMNTYAESIRKNNMIGQYDYVKAGTDIKTRYHIEFTRDQKVFDIMDTTKFTFDMLNKLEYDYLQDAITDYNKLYYDDTVLHVMLFEQILLNDEIILEQCKDMTGSSILPIDVQKRVNRIEEDNKILTNELNLYNEFIKKYKAEKLFQEFKLEVTKQ